MNNDKRFNLRYDSETIEGELIDSLRSSRVNLSRLIRQSLLAIKGYEILKNQDKSPQEIEEICSASISFLAGQIELAKINLEKCQNNNLERQINKLNTTILSDKIRKKSLKKSDNNLEKDIFDSMLSN